MYNCGENLQNVSEIFRNFAAETKRIGMKKNKNFYRDTNRDYLKLRAAEEGMTVLPSGAVYRWIKRGPIVAGAANSGFARPSDIVYCHYTGRLIDGSVFDSTRSEGNALPACFVVRDLIMGFQMALTRMRAGDEMEIVIPAEYAYGKQRAGDIPPHSTLIFDIEVIKVEPH